jgi:hypothetical protein
VHISAVEEFAVSTGASGKRVAVRRDARLAHMHEKGYYNVLLDAAGFGPTELCAYRSAAMDRAVLMTVEEVAMHSIQFPGVRRVQRFAFMEPSSSIFQRMNDAAYVPGCTGLQYVGQEGTTNHAHFVLGFGPSGEVDAVYLHFHRRAAPGEELYLTYGWPFWEAVPPPAQPEADFSRPKSRQRCALPNVLQGDFWGVPPARRLPRGRS